MTTTTGIRITLALDPTTVGAETGPKAVKGRKKGKMEKRRATVDVRGGIITGGIGIGTGVEGDASSVDVVCHGMNKV